MRNPFSGNGKSSSDDSGSGSDAPMTWPAKRPLPPTDTPEQIITFFANQSIIKDKQRLDHLFIKSLLAGAQLSFGGIFVLILAGGTSVAPNGLNVIDPGLVKLLQGIFFPVGLYIIIAHQMELFTSNVMIMVIGMMARKVGLKALVKSWVVSWVGNMIGALFFAAILVRYSAILAAEPFVNSGAAVLNLKVIKPEWHQIFLRAVGCNWLVCLAVFNAAQSREIISKIVAIYLPISVFIASTYEHVVANFFLLPASMMLASETAAGNPLNVGVFIYKSVIPVTLGNIAGAVFFISIPYYHLFYVETPDTNDFAGKITQEDEINQVVPGGHPSKDPHSLPMHMGRKV